MTYVNDNVDRLMNALILEIESRGNPNLTGSILAEILRQNYRYRLMGYPLRYSLPSRQQMRILYHIAQGESNTSIAHLLQMGHGTVDQHITRMFDKFNVRSRAQLVAQAYENGILPMMTSPHKE